MNLTHSGLFSSALSDSSTTILSQTYDENTKESVEEENANENGSNEDNLEEDFYENTESTIELHNWQTDGGLKQVKKGEITVMKQRFRCSNWNKPNKEEGYVKSATFIVCMYYCYFCFLLLNICCI